MFGKASKRMGAINKITTKTTNMKILKSILNFVLLYIIAMPIFCVGVGIYWVGKIITSIGFLFMFQFHSAKESISQGWWNPTININDAI